jgi:energy-coupling factor transporter ATP-binding protein EcfA2
MSQKIIIKNFGAIEYAEIDIKKILVLIGEQASGKSTIAKLIYFFKSLREDLLGTLLELDVNQNLEQSFSDACQKKFLDWFGAMVWMQDFEITFYYDASISDRYVKISTSYKSIKVLFEKTFLDELIVKDIITKNTPITDKQANKSPFLAALNVKEEHSLWDRLFQKSESERKKDAIELKTKIMFDDYFATKLFIVAGRSATVNYSELFERELYAELKNRINRNQTNKEILPIVDDLLLFQFMKQVIKLKEFYSLTHGIASFFTLNKKLRQGDAETEESTEIEEKEITYLISKILKGEYLYNDGIEKIILLDGKTIIPLSQASSGQMEVIRILQDIVDVVTKGQTAFRVIEEPEAHLFPVAQKDLVELFSLMVNHDPHNQLIITTHSPYILSAFNNLLFAQRVVDKNESLRTEVAEIINEQVWIKAEDFSAYSLGTKISETGKYCEPIFEQEKGMIQQNYLDTVSEYLGVEFHKLYKLHAKTFARR